jgi:hypothetical protein
MPWMEATWMKNDVLRFESKEINKRNNKAGIKIIAK